MFIEVLNLNNYNLVKQAFVSPDTEMAKKAQELMDIIYKENPSFFPYGLNVAGHDEVYIINDALTKEAAGFVGWQERKENNKKIGSYSIGILPKFRKNGIAKEAVAKVIREKAKSVDRVVAYIKRDNIPSKKLAQSLNVSIIEEF